MNRVRVAMIGVGNISGIYLKNITQTFRELELIGVCDLVRARAEKAAAEYGVPKSTTPCTTPSPIRRCRSC